MNFIKPEQLHQWLEGDVPLQLVDVREAYEVDSGALPSLHVPMADLPSRLEDVHKDVPVVVYCKSGKRAKAVVHLLEVRYGYENIYCLEGGIEAYVQCTQAEIEVYS